MKQTVINGAAGVSLTNAPQRELPDRKRKVVTYNEDEHLENVGLVKDVEN